MDKRPIHDQYARLPWLIVVMTAAFLTIGVIADRYIEHQLVAAKGESMALAAGEIAHKLDLLLAERANDIRLLSRAPVFRGNDAAAKNALLDSFKQIYPLYLLIGVTDARGRVVAATDRAVIGTDKSKSDWFLAARNTNSIRIGDVQPSEDAGGLDAVSITMPLRGPGDIFLGVVTSRVGLPLIEDVVSRTLRSFQEREDFSGTFHYRFATLAGSVFVDSEPEYRGNLNLDRLELPSVQLSHAGKPGYVEEEHPHLKNRIITGFALTGGAGGVPDLQWTILLYTSKSELVAPIRTLLLKLAAAWVLVWLPMLVFSLWSTRRLRTEWTHAQDERHHAEAAESKYRNLVEQASDIIYRVDLNGYFTYINPSVTRFKGYTQEELIGQHFAMHIRPDARAAATRFYMRQFARRTPSTYYEYPVIKKDGGEIWLGQNVELLIENGQVVGFQAVARDVTKRKQAEEALAASERRWRTMIEAQPECVKITMEDGTLLEMNAAGLAAIEADSLEQVRGRSICPLIAPAHREEFARFNRRVFHGQPGTMQYEIVGLKGRHRWMDTHAIPLKDDLNATIGVLSITRDITERKDAEEALRTTNKFLQALVQTSPLAIINLDVQSHVVSWNRAAEDMLGWSESEVLGKPLPYIPPGKEAEADAVWAESLQGPGLNGVEIRRQKKDGTPIDLVVWSRTFRDAQGKPTTAVGILADITERKLAEAALRDSEMQMRLFMEATADCVWNWDMTTAHVARNAGFQKLFGYAPEEIIPNIDWWRERVHPDDRERVLMAFQDAVASGRNTCEYDYRFRRRDGSYAVVTDRAFTLRDDAGTVVRALGAMTDITERKHAEDALRESEQRLALVLDAANEGIWDWNIQTGEVYYSPRWIELLGYEPEDVPPHISFWESIIHPEDLPRVKDTLRAHFEGQFPTYQCENRLRTKTGTWRWNLDRGKVIEWDAEGRPIRMVGTDADITERKLAEYRLEKINACFLGFGVNPETNINSLTALGGDLLGATCALYNFLDGDLLHSVGQWNTPPGYMSVSPAAGHVCLDVIRQDASRPLTVRHLQETPYARTDPNVLPYKLQTYVGMAVRCQGKAVGSLCAVFQRDFSPSEADTKLLGIIAAAIGVEEERRLAEAHQKRLLEELAESRNRFEMFFRQTPSAISITTIKEGRFLDLNQQAELLTGYSREELIGRTTVEMSLYVDPSDRPNLVQELRQKGLLTDLEREIRTKSGQIRTAVFSLVPIMMGTEPCLLSIAHDITERKQAEQRLHEQSRQQAIEAELSVLAVTIQNLPSLLSTAAGLVLNALEVNYCEVLELMPNGTDLRLCASAGWRGDEIGQVRTLETGSPSHAALAATKPVIRTLPKESRFGGPKWLHEHGVVTSMSVSIPGQNGPWGVLGVYTTSARPFSRDDVNFLQTVSSILGTAIERLQTESELRSANQSLRLLSRQLLQVQEDDRRAIARDLHDEIGQSLTAIKLNVERAQRTGDREARADIMRDCAQITELVLAQVRNLSLDLHPSILDDLGLPYALRWYADRQAERAGLKVELTADPSQPRLPPEVEIACFRIAQEALTNVVRHARANLAGIVLKQDSTRVELCIKDDGIGFVMGGPQADGRTSVGLASMQERARLLGGTVKITSAPRSGTTVVATLPLSVTSQAGTPAEQAMQP